MVRYGTVRLCYGTVCSTVPYHPKLDGTVRYGTVMLRYGYVTVRYGPYGTVMLRYGMLRYTGFDSQVRN